MKRGRHVPEGRPCDYCGMSYAKLTGGPGIQWPCNERFPDGATHLYTDGVFNTDPDECETLRARFDTGLRSHPSSTAHKIRTGAPSSRPPDYIRRLKSRSRSIRFGSRPGVSSIISIPERRLAAPRHCKTRPRGLHRDLGQTRWRTTFRMAMRWSVLAARLCRWRRQNITDIRRGFFYSVPLRVLG